MSDVRSVWQAVIPTNDVTFLQCRGIYCGTAGNVTVKGNDGVNYTMKNLAAGVWHPVAATMIISATTTALDLLIGY